MWAVEERSSQEAKTKNSHREGALQTSANVDP